MRYIHCTFNFPFQIMAFFSVALSAIALLQLPARIQARPAITAVPTYTVTPTPAGCEYHGSFYQPGEVIYEDECHGAKCAEFDPGRYGVLFWHKMCFFSTTSGPWPTSTAEPPMTTPEPPVTTPKPPVTTPEPPTATPQHSTKMY